MKMKWKELGKGKKCALGILLLAVLSVCVLGKGALGTTIKIGFSGRETLREWSASYRLLSSKEQRRVGSEDQPHRIEVEVETVSGALALTITNQDGSVAYTGQALPTCSFSVEVEGRAKIKLNANSHRGRYTIRWE